MKKEIPTVTKTKDGTKRKQIQMQVVLASKEVIDLFGIGGSLEKFARHIEYKGLYIRHTKKGSPMHDTQFCSPEIGYPVSPTKNGLPVSSDILVRRIPPHTIREIRWNEKKRAR